MHRCGPLVLRDADRVEIWAFDRESFSLMWRNLDRRGIECRAAKRSAHHTKFPGGTRITPSSEASDRMNICTHAHCLAVIIHTGFKNDDTAEDFTLISVCRENL